MSDKAAELKRLRVIPGVGEVIARDLWNQGFRKVSDLTNEDPEKIYSNLCKHRGQQIDRCALYVFRCAIYYASTTAHDPEKLKWWNWKDEKYKGI